MTLAPHSCAVRSLQTGFMKKHPRLARKLRLLYNLKANPEISNNQHLATVLGVSRQSVSKWGAGSRTRSGDAIPDAHFFRLGQIFGIDSYLFTLEIEEFEEEVRLILDHRNRRRLRRPQQIFHNNLPAASERLFGRKAELLALNEAWNQQTTNVVQVIGISGAGKSSLINEWLVRMDAENYCGADTVLAWSFHQGYGSQASIASPEAFLRRALALLGESDAGQYDPESQAIRLVQWIRRHRTLLVLDGVQNLQNAYGPGFGHFHDPGCALLLRELAKENPGLCVLTSRLGNADLETIGQPRAKLITLGGIGFGAACELMRSCKIRGKAERIRHPVEQHQGLPMTLRLLGRHLDLVRDGELAHYMELVPLLEESGEDERAAEYGRECLARLPLHGQRMFFCLLSLYQRQASLREILKTCRGLEIEGLTSEILSLTHMELRYGIFALEKAGIVRVWRKPQGMKLELARFPGAAMVLNLKLHLPELWRAGNRLLFARMRERETSAGESPRNQEARYLAVINGVRAGCWHEAFTLYFRDIRNSRYAPPDADFRHLDQASLREFFADPWSRVDSGLEDEEARIDLQCCAAINLAIFGDIGEMIALSRTCLKWLLARGNWAKAGAFAGEAITILFTEGRRKDAARVLKRIRGKLGDVNDPAAVEMLDGLAAVLADLRAARKKERPAAWRRQP